MTSRYKELLAAARCNCHSRIYITFIDKENEEKKIKAAMLVLPDFYKEKH